MKKYKIIISEPWDFKTLNDDNVVTGKIVKVVSSTCLIFESDDFLNFGSELRKMFVLKPRYEKQILDNENNFEGTVGGGGITINDDSEMNEKYIEEHSTYLFIGRLEKI